MKTEIKNLLNLKHYFKIVKSTDSNITFSLMKPSQILIKNIYRNWLQCIHSKTYKEMPVYINKSFKELKQPTIFGNIEQNFKKYANQTTLELNESSRSSNKSELQLHLILPKHDAMQYFIKWQRYRKYWWSSISTTPSLFRVNDIKYENKSANVDIVAQLPSGQQPVENVSINFEENDKCSQLTCGMSLENALKILLLDGLNSNSKQEYLKLHRKIAPYKISFALNFKGEYPLQFLRGDIDRADESEPYLKLPLFKNLLSLCHRH